MATAKKKPAKKKAKKPELCTEGHTRFFCHDGQVFCSVKELYKALGKMDMETFKHHCNEERCDFANWVEHVFGKKTAAKKIAKAYGSKTKVRAAIKELC